MKLKKNMYFMRFFSIIASVLVSISIIGCQNNSGGSDFQTRTFSGAISVGDIVDFELKETTFTFDNLTNNDEVSGTYVVRNDVAILNDSARRLTGDDSRTVQFYEARELIVNGVAQSADFTVPFIWNETALVVVAPDSDDSDDSETNSIGVFYPKSTPDLNEIHGKKHHFLEVFNPLDPTKPLGYGTYTISKIDNNSATVQVNGFDLADDTSDGSESVSLHVQGDFIIVTGSSPTVSARVLPSGTMLIDHGPNEGISVGVADTNSDADKSGLYFIVAPQNTEDVILLYLNNNVIKYEQVSVEEGEVVGSGELALQVSSEGNNVLIGVDEEEDGSFVKVRIMIEPSGGVIFGALLYSQDEDGSNKEYDNFIGMKI